MPSATADPLLPLIDLPGVADACTRAREDVDRLLRHRVLRKQSAAVSGESLLRAARASAELENHGYQLEAIRAGQIDDPVVTGCLRVSGELGRITEVWEKAPLQAIAALHVQAASGSLHRDDLGRPVGGPEVSVRLQQLTDTLRAPRSRDVPGVVVAAIVHGELLALKPFAGLNGVVARGAARVALISTGVDPKALAAPEVGHVSEQRDYEQSIAAYRTGSADGVAQWIVHCAGALSAGAVEGLAICEAVLRG
ncbi:oxidoreductase [Cumulibacter soli]|uniref:oxidoreductase n=1 Tax=Cumulibacter soli TaxID=2546344 RepID=UPI001FBAC382|nr:oxidoreductase [Cumulibacter soli]